MSDELDLVENAVPVGVEQPKTVLKPEELEKIRKDAREKVEKDIRKAAMAKAMAEAEEQARIEAGLMPAQGPAPTEEIMNVRINVPKYVPFIRIDRTKFFHGRTYPVPKSQYLYIMDQMQHCWRQELQTKGEWNGPGHRQQNVNIDQHGNVINRAGAFR